MSYVTSQSSVYPPPPGTPSEAETLRRQAFQAAHPEVGFAFQAGCGTPWVAYWVDVRAAWAPQHQTAASMAELLDKLDVLFKDS